MEISYPETGYTNGEAGALVAPLVGLTPGTIKGYLILAQAADGTFCKAGNADGGASELALLSGALLALGADLRGGGGGEPT